MNATLISHAKRVAFQGEPGAYANLAAREALPHLEAVGKPTFEAALDAVRSGDTDLAIIPVENSVYGRIADVHFLVRYFGRAIKGHIAEGPRHFFILGEHFHRVRHQLLGLKGAKLKDIKTVYSQAPALGQCRKIVKELGLIDKQWSDTAGAAQTCRRIERSQRRRHRLQPGGGDLWPGGSARRCRRRAAQHDALSDCRARGGRVAQ